MNVIFDSTANNPSQWYEELAYANGWREPNYPVPAIPIKVKIDTGYGQGAVYLFERGRLVTVLA